MIKDGRFGSLQEVRRCIHDSFGVKKIRAQGLKRTGGRPVDQVGGVHGTLRHVFSAKHLHEKGNGGGAQKFHPVVRRGDLRRAADRQQGVVVACDLQLVRDPFSPCKGIFDRAGGQLIVGGKAGVKAKAFRLQAFQETGGLRDPGGTEEGAAVRTETVLGQRTAEAGKLLFSAVAGGNGKGRPAVCCPVRSGCPQAPSRPARRRRQQNRRRFPQAPRLTGKRGTFFCRFAQIAVVLALFFDKLRSGQDQRVHAAGEEKLEIFFLFLQPVAGADTAWRHSPASRAPVPADR